MGPRPRTSDTLPHIQLDQWPPDSVIGNLLVRARSLPNATVQQSRMAAPETWALALRDEFAHGPASAFIDDHEFCHLHPPPEGFLHLMLPNQFRQRVIELGWGEPHLAVRSAFLPETLVMIYAPRNEEELSAVLQVVVESYHFACGSDSNDLCATNLIFG